MMLIYRLLMLMHERLLLIKSRLWHILLTVTVTVLTHCRAMMLLVVEIFHAVTLAAG